MRVNLQKWTMGIVAGSGRLHTELDVATCRVLYRHLEPLRVRGLKDLESFWVEPPPAKATPPGITEMNYFAAKEKITSRFMLSPVVSVDDPRWPTYRVKYVEQVRDLTVDLLGRVETRLIQEGHSVDLGAVRKDIARDLDKLAADLRAETPVRNSLETAIGTKKPAAKKPAAKKPDAKKPDAKKPAAKKPDAKKPDAKKPVAKKRAAKKPAAKKPVAKKPAAKKPAAKKPAAKK